MTILHVINLDTIGGVEELFIHFLNTSHQQHALFITGSQIHEKFADVVKSKARYVLYEKYFMRCTIPKPLRRLIAGWRLRRKQFSQVVLWNRIEPLEKLQTLFGSSPITYYEHGASWIEKKESSLLSFFQKMNTLIANSYAAKAILQLKWGVTQPITVLDNPLRPDILAREGHKCISLPVRLGYIGRLIPLKSPLVLIDTAAILKQMNIPFTLTIAGTGEEKPSLLKRIEALGLSDVCALLGTINDVSSFYDSIDILIIPSIREPLGLVALEAGARGVPVIASRVDGLCEAVKDQETGILLPPTVDMTELYSKKLPDQVYDAATHTLIKPKLLAPKAIATAIKTLIDDTALYQKMSQNGILRTKQRANFTQYTQALDLILQKK